MEQTPVMSLLIGSLRATCVWRKGRAFENLKFLSNMTCLAAVLPPDQFLFLSDCAYQEDVKVHGQQLHREGNRKGPRGVG